LLSGGIPINRALEMAQYTSGNSVVAKAIAESREEILKGGKIAASLKKHDVFPHMAIRMVSAGEETGSLSYLIAGPGVSNFWLSPAEGVAKKIHAMYADTLATYVPPGVLDSKGPEELRNELNPTVAIGEMKATLDRIAQWNRLPLDSQGRADLSQMRVVLLRVYDGRQRERLRLEEFRRLNREPLWRRLALKFRPQKGNGRRSIPSPWSGPQPISIRRWPTWY
jgi:hypothetical protein